MCKDKNTKMLVCPVCDGTGQDKDEDYGFYTERPCPRCLGEGVLIITVQEVRGEKLRVFGNPCDNCIVREEKYTHSFCQDCKGNPNI